MTRAIGVASVLYGVSILLSRLLGVVREAVIGRTLGAGPEADVYYAAFVIPDFLNYLLAGGALSLVFIPIFQRHLTAGREDEGWTAFSVIANFLLLAGIAGTAALWLAAPRLTPVLFPGVEAARQGELALLVRIILPAQIFHVTGGLLSATLQARDRHALPALAPLVYTAAIIGGGVLFGARLGAAAFAWGVLVGSALGPFALPLVGCLRTGLRWRPVLSWRHPDFRRYLVLSLPVMLGFSVVVVDDFVVKHFASVVGAGVIAELQYARTLMRVPMGMFGLAAGMAAFPTITRLVAGGRPAEAYATLVRAARMMLLLAFAAQAALTVAGGDVATVIWGERRFAPSQLAAIGRYTGFFCLGLWAWSAQGLIGRGFYARQNTWTPTVVGTIVVVAAYPLYGWLAARLGGAGLALASSIAISAYLVILAILLRRSLVGRAAAPAGPGLVDGVLRLAACAALATLVGEGAEHLASALPPLLRGAIAGTAALIACFAAAVALRVPEADTLRALVTRRLRRLAGTPG